MTKLVSAFSRILTHRWLLLLIGLLCISALVWFLGPLIQIGEIRPLEAMSARLLVILTLVGLWGANSLRLAYQDRRRNKEIKAELDRAGDEFADSEFRKAIADEIEAMSNGFTMTVRKLKRVSQRGFGDKRSVYQLPWYLVLGPTGAGKTTMLRKSGLRFSLIAARERGNADTAEGNHYCQWWLADEAVIIDTAGRHTLQDGNPKVDRLAWQKLLGLLWRHRSRQPIDGVILVVSITELLTAGSGHRSASIEAVRQRLQELALEFKRSIPVYCVVTKCDQLVGFTDFFDRLDGRLKEQVWGVTFGSGEGEDAEVPVKAFAAAYDRLIERLQTHLLGCLDREPDIERRAAIQGFPTRLSLLRQPLDDYLTEVFMPSRFDGQLGLRGVYFASAIQDGEAVDHLTSLFTSMFGIAAKPFSAARNAASSYFLKPLLQDVIFRESGLAANAAPSIRRRTLIRRLAAAGACIVLASTGLAWWTSFNSNQNYISTVDAKVAEFDENISVLSEDITDISAPLPVLDLLRTIPGGYADREEPAPLATGFGLDQRDKLGSATSAAYRRVVQAALLPRLVNRLEQQIRESLDQPDRLSDILKVYLMIVDPTRFDRGTVDRWYDVDVNRWLPGRANAYWRSTLEGHLAALFEDQLTQPLPNESLVMEARSVLGDVSAAERAYAAIKADAERTAKPWTPRQSLGRVADLVFDRASIRPVPGFYTIDAYQMIFPARSLPVVKALVEDAWVIGYGEPDEERQAAAYEALHDEVVELYLADYVERWDGLLETIRLDQPRDFRQVSSLLDDLIGDNAVLRRFFEEVGRQTKLARRADPDADLSDVVTLAGDLEGLGNRLTELPGNASASAESDPGRSVERRYARIHKLTDPAGDGQSGIDRIVTPLERFGRHVAAISEERSQRGNAAQNDTQIEIALLAERQVQPLRRWIQQLAGEVRSLSGKLTRTLINERWQDQLASLCRTSLARHYPFDPESSTDLRLAEFSRFFAPNGLLDRFFQDNLADLVDTSSRPWKPRATGSSGAGVSLAAITAFEKAAQIRDIFFQDGNSPAYVFALSPISLDPSVSKFQLEFGGDQRNVYRHGPVRPQALNWPGSSALAGARVVFTTFDPKASPASASARGAWGWFRLLDRFRGQSDAATTPNRISFELDGLKATYAINPLSSAVNVDVLNLFDDFYCPSSL